MDGDNQNKIYRVDDDGHRIYRDICGIFAINGYYNSHLKSSTHIDEIRKIQLNNTNTNKRN